MIISTRNALADLTPSDVISPLPADGYDRENLWRGGIARAWRSAVGLTTATLEFHTGLQPIDFVAVFAARMVTSSISSVRVRRHDTFGGPGTLVGTIELDARGDGALVLPVPIAAASWSITISAAAPSLLSVGEVWMGRADDTIRAPATISETRDAHTIVNLTEAMGRRTARLTQPTRSYSIDWPPMDREESDALMRLFDATQGASRPCVLIPEEIGVGPVYGWLDDTMGRSIDPSRWWSGMGLTFHEEGRGLG